MAEKILFQTTLTQLDTSDIDNRGTLRVDEYGKTYRYVKNVSATALVAAGACLKALTSVVTEMNKNVRSVDTATAATASIRMPAGVPVTAVAASGSGTGDHGWVQVAGPARVTMIMSDTAAWASGTAGLVSICTNLPASAFWDVPQTDNSASDANIVIKGVRLAVQLVEGTADTARSAAVEVICL